ncbi:hypothetical protein CLOM_g11375, partial [Closterium sp. NIES-68]
LPLAAVPCSCCPLLALPTVRCSPPATRRPLLAARCAPHAARRLLPAARCSPPAARPLPACCPLARAQRGP